MLKKKKKTNYAKTINEIYGENSLEEIIVFDNIEEILISLYYYFCLHNN